MEGKGINIEELRRKHSDTGNGNREMGNRILSVKVNAVLNAIIQVCKIIFSVITFSYSAHILGVNGIGIFQFSSTTVGYFALIASLGIGTYAIREGASLRDNEEKLSAFVAEMFSFNLLTTFVSYVLLTLLVIFSEKLKAYNLYIIVLSSTILFGTLGANWINSVFEDYLYLTIRYIIIQAMSIVALFLFVKTEESLLVYTAINVFARSGGDILNFFHIRKRVRIRITRKIAIKRHLRSILMLFASDVAVTIYVSSDITLLGLFKNDEEVGIYSTASNIYNIVKRIVYSFVTVLLPRFSYLLRDSVTKETRKLYNRVMDANFLIAMPATVGIMCIGKQLIQVMAGEDFTEGYLSLCILSFAIVMVAYSNLFCMCIVIPKKMDYVVMIASVIPAILNIVLNIIFIPSYGLVAAACTTVFSELAVLVLYFYYAYKVIKVKVDLSNVVTTCLGCVGIFLTCHFLNFKLYGDVIELTMKIIVSVTVYALILVVLRNKIAIEYLNSMIRKIRG